MACCVTLHNMIVENEGDGVAQTNDFEAPREQVEIPEDQDAAQLMNFLQMHQNICAHQVHAHLLNDLMEHMWILLEICPRGNNKMIIIIFPCT